MTGDEFIDYIEARMEHDARLRRDDDALRESFTPLLDAVDENPILGIIVHGMYPRPEAMVN